ncbi:MAG: glucosamine-6-phosphate deaminase [Dysgonamonadaceae bacterium]|jgi:glucosamine-6-phosphate deaminase|nr:glucosamine-6-phosphate deaminase [Dysgonamonadaceae bacterium]
MKFDLSSEITLESIPESYYNSHEMLEHMRQTKFEKLRTNICRNPAEGSRMIANLIEDVIREKQKQNKKCLLGLSGGTSPLLVYDELSRKHREENLDFSNVLVFNVTEFFPIPADGRHSNAKLLREHLIDKVNIAPENFITPGADVNRENVYDFCRRYEELVQQNSGSIRSNYEGLDYVLVSVGLAGNIAYNEPGSQISSITRLMLLDDESRSDLKHFYPSADEIPASAITMGMSLIQAAAKVTLLAWGERKSTIIKDIIQGKVDDNIPASFLQLHPNALAVIDLEAASQLTRIRQPWMVNRCEWTDKLIRRAIVWLCMKTGKPILKLTNKDYNQHGLDELLALYGSAYEVNIKIFNDLQHTITGWPGGKPDADDTNRPERAVPYPKRVVVFSPHPDDDVISMGGTLQRLVDQNHDVHVAYQTSGNIAVGDEDAIRTFSLFRRLNKSFGGETTVLDDKCAEVLSFLKNGKQPGDDDTSDVLFMKGQIRKEEALAACRYMGVNQENVHFLELPFYETGKIKKAPISERDVNKIIPLLQKVKPHQIYLAGDLADPHGTHKVCLNAALAAIHELKDEEWMKTCRIWMYRGAWAEWEIDHIEMAVPMSPEQLRRKRNSILKHQSQMESAPFLGNDERLFWQRAEDRNRATAALYCQLGLASYEAIEAFVEYKQLKK